MDIWLIFQNYFNHVITMGGRRRLCEPGEGPKGRQVEIRRGIRQENPVSHSTLRDQSEHRMVHKVADATLPRKASKEWVGYPYRKPTQVGEEKILRRK